MLLQRTKWDEAEHVISRLDLGENYFLDKNKLKFHKNFIPKKFYASKGYNFLWRVKVPLMEVKVNFFDSEVSFEEKKKKKIDTCIIDKLKDKETSRPSYRIIMNNVNIYT